MDINRRTDNYNARETLTITLTITRDRTMNIFSTAEAMSAIRTMTVLEAAQFVRATINTDEFNYALLNAMHCKIDDYLEKNYHNDSALGSVEKHYFSGVVWAMINAPFASDLYHAAMYELMSLTTTIDDI